MAKSFNLASRYTHITFDILTSDKRDIQRMMREYGIELDDSIEEGKYTRLFTVTRSNQVQLFLERLNNRAIVTEICTEIKLWNEL